MGGSFGRIYRRFSLCQLKLVDRPIDTELRGEGVGRKSGRHVDRTAGEVRRRIRASVAEGTRLPSLKTSKFKTGELPCVYRADLYLQRRKEEEEAKRRLGDAVPKKKEDEDVPAAGEKVEPKKAARTAGQHVVKTEPDSSKDTLSGSPTLTGLPALLPPLPALPSLPTPYDKPSDTIVKCESPLSTFATPQSIFAPAPSPADYFTTSTALRSDSVSSQAGFSTNSPSPSFTISETDLSSWPSPCSPFDEWCDDLPTTYPPVPYPPACPATSDFNSPWSEACSSLFIPALVLSTPLQSLGLTDISTPSCSTLPLGDPLKIDSSVTGIDSTLTLPFAPSFAGEWNGGGSSEL
ncbi:transcription factor [Rhodotorula toruloides]|uniref:Transcription factor n=1 Tax=Rhodotorula toruloides TaxID=5286 RepID=A0A511KII5_RHOTO|nr:transcription factor [Rhodotorula toruloides]